MRSTVSKHEVLILLSGPPWSSKTVFLLEILKGLNDVYFVGGAGTSTVCIRYYSFKSNAKYLLIYKIIIIIVTSNLVRFSKRRFSAIVKILLSFGVMYGTSIQYSVFNSCTIKHIE
ncbi:MAG TPA: hypothetical protein VD694_05655 [Nitrososphaeraceae archaeon]|nr:hypothetical protein [Nitrososphaeraceae archaeon]